MEAAISDLLGKVMASVENVGGERLVFTTIDGDQFEFYHDQDCCESVTIEEIAGDLDDLVGAPIFLAEEVVSQKNPAGVVMDYQDSFTWTFYKFATRKGYVDVRWYGESNGYYSESVQFKQIRNSARN